MIHSLDELEAHLYGEFKVTQISPDTFLDAVLGVDYIYIDPNKKTEIHRHNRSDNVIFITGGSGIVIIDDDQTAISKGMRILIYKGQFHGFITTESHLEFVSLQIPPILDKKNNYFDRELKPTKI